MSCLVVLAGCPQFADLGDIDLPPSQAQDSETSPGDPTDGLTDGAGDTDAPQGPPDDWDDEMAPQAGTRLRPILRTADDGSAYQVAWQDTQENVRCTFRTAEDGVRRCYPEQRTAVYYFADPQCAVPLVRRDDVGEAAVVELEGSDRCRVSALYRLGDVQATTVHRAGDEGCVVHSHDEGYFAGTFMDHADFVAAAVEPAAGVSRVVPLLLAADDGARAIVGAWDREHAEEVEAGAGLADTRWFSRHAAGAGNIFRDEACSMPVAAASRCVPPDLLPTTAQGGTDICGAGQRQRWRLGAQVDPSAAYFENGECYEHESRYWSRLWTVGEELFDADFGLAPATTIDGTRLQRRAHANPEGEPLLATAEFFDPELGESCWFVMNEALGVATCQPRERGVLAGIFLDDECTQEVAYVASFDGCPDPTAKWAIEGDTVRPLLAQTEWGDFKLENGACVIADGDFDYPGGLEEHSVYSVGPAANITLVAATDIIQ